MADFITNEVSLDRHGRSDGWFIEPADARPALFLSDDELDALVAWRTGVGIWSATTPTRIEDMAPGTTFVARTKWGHEWPFVAEGGNAIRATVSGYPDGIGLHDYDIHPSTIRDVREPEQ